MGLDFDWTTNDDQQREAVLLSTVRRHKRSWRPWLIGIATAVILALGAWIGYRIVQQKNQAALEQAAQAYQQLQQQAITSHNGALFQSVNAAAPAWLSAQLQPRSWHSTLLNPQILHVEPHIHGLIATIQWRNQADWQQRDIFYAWRKNTLVQAPIPIDYWGDIVTVQQPWGRLTMREVDSPWIDEITQFVNRAILQECNERCRAQRLPFALTIRSSFATTAAPRQLAIASPRLWAMDAVGNPAPQFWQALAQMLHNQFAPARVRFAAPVPLVDRLQRLAEQFSAEHPTIQIDIVDLESLSPAPEQLFADVDGAYMLPTVSMITSGLIQDLTDFADSDPQVEAGDFEPRIWQASQWQSRLWMLPQSATMHVLFYDRALIEEMGLPTLPTDDWAGFTQFLEQARAHKRFDANSNVLFDVDADLLAAYASQLHCSFPPDQQQAQTHCLGEIGQANWAAGLDWYRAAVVDTQTMMDLSDHSA
ncbi:MAG: extracellular solute-binding protein, partial [Caldilineaceae bacterium]|nr:extracellular solute-binding protein [Caldilineaceae bacterium]